MRQSARYQISTWRQLNISYGQMWIFKYGGRWLLTIHVYSNLLDHYSLTLRWHVVYGILSTPYNIT